MRALIQPDQQTQEQRQRFFSLIFKGGEGYLCLASIKPKGGFEERFFKYPHDVEAAYAYINRRYIGRNLYFCPQLFNRPRRNKEVVSFCNVIWADLDECDPGIVEPPPNIVLRTSQNRYQGFWSLDSPVDPTEAEDAARRIAYKYESFGADRSGWDLTQLLRIPLTYNVKQMPPFVVALERFEEDKRFSIVDFKRLPTVPGTEFVDIPLPEQLLQAKPDPIFEKYKGRLDPRILELYQDEPEVDWSSALWLLERLLFESGVTREEAFVVCHHAACNKYARDNRPPSALWRDVCKASLEDEWESETAAPIASPLLTSDERATIIKYESFVERYIKWAKTRSDAAPQYHEAGGFTILSAILAGAVRLKTTFGTIVPNMWFLILGDTTTTRKSTAMDMAMELLLEINDDALLATDGSIEGLMTAIAARPGKPGVFWRDEFSGLLEAIQKRDYLSGMTETLTKLYDGKHLKRVLRKEIIEIRDPILILLCGGIRGRIHELLSYEQALSGFVPRFVFIEGEADMSRIRPLGPATVEGDNTRDAILRELQEIHERYNTEMTARIGTQQVTHPAQFKAELTPEAWARYNAFDEAMLQYGMSAPDIDVYTPMMDRLAKATLKAAILMAASRQDPHKRNKVVVELDDVLRAIYYADKWRDHAISILDNLGKTVNERRVEAVWRLIRKYPDGVRRSTIMQQARLTAREADWIFDTLEQRAMLKVKRRGKGATVHPLRPGQPIP